MQKLSTALALLGLTAAAVAQNCNGAPPNSSLMTRDPFTINYYTGSGITSINMYFDADVQTPVTLTSIDAFTYDQGAGNPVVPTQVGNTTNANVWMCPVTRIGNEQLIPDPLNPTPSPWILLGSGTITVTAYPATSPIVFATPVAMPSGIYGVCVEIEAVPATQPNGAGLHTLIAVPTTPAYVAQDTFMTLTNQGIQARGWRDAAGAWNYTNLGAAAAYDVNLALNYTPDPQSAVWTVLGEGCYFRPKGFYEDFRGQPAGYDLANTSLQMLPLSGNYLVLPGASTPITAPTSAPISATATTNGLYGWDDGLSAPITLPFTFPHASGSTTSITIGANGFVYLDAVNTTDWTYCGAPYASTFGWQTGAPRIAAHYGDLDCEPASLGNLYYDVDPSNAFVTITWFDVPEWTANPASAPRCTFSIRLHATGQVDVNYNGLGGLAAGNTVMVGYSVGLGDRLPASSDLSASMPFQSGDGAIPPILGMDTRPVLGTNPSFVTSNITPGTFAQMLVLGVAGTPVPIDLTAFGLPGCNQYIVPFATMINFLTVNNTFEQQIGVPNSPAFQNLQYFAQAAPLTAGLNPAGLLTSNGVCAKFGL